MADPGVYVEAHRDTLQSLADLCAALPDADWALPTGCPGWSVKDQVSHVCDVESLILGRQSMPEPAELGGHVVNAVGARMEPGVLARRGWATEKLLDELRSLTAERLDRLAAVTADQLEQTAYGHPLGPMPLRTFLTLRVFDLFSHEQDVRRAVGQPGHGDGAAARLVVPFALKQLGRLIHRNAPAMHGRQMHLDVEGMTATLDFTGERSVAHLPADNAPWAMVFDISGFMAWIGGRSDREDFAWYGREPADEDLQAAHEAFRANAAMTP